MDEKNYIAIQGWMVSELGLKGNELLIYAIIYGFTQKENQWYTGSRKYLSEWTGATKQTVGNYLKSLADKGYIEKREQFVNGVKFCDYRVKKSPGVGEKFTQGRLKIHEGVGEKFTPINNSTYIKEHNNRTYIYSDPVEDNFEMLWDLFPNKKGKSAVSKKTKKEIYKIGYDHMVRAIERYANEVKGVDIKFVKHGSTFFNGSYKDYLDDVYVPPRDTSNDAILTFLNSED